MESQIFGAVFVNGKFCKDPKLVVANDFFLSGLYKPGNASNAAGSAVTLAFVEQLLGLNTLGISLVRIDFVPNGGLNPPHTHPREIEILLNIGKTSAVAFVALNSQNLSTITITVTIANFVFGSNPPINPNVLTKAFMLEKNMVKYLQSRF
ncbi:hypothetical protein SLEP1_g15787 [Rubroshorea leprosula]|uniref:Cupin type-1 domain-containing protein n=1 Tax=Rubroshorea leprosula TaxID=152421 RepID=A0AAV5INL0_9ROSI|nr:hypothetical protein SLEP1_g15787 [Rubroshorea leprosula]